MGTRSAANSSSALDATPQPTASTAYQPGQRVVRSSLTASSGLPPRRRTAFPETRVPAVGAPDSGALIDAGRSLRAGPVTHAAWDTRWKA